MKPAILIFLLTVPFAQDRTVRGVMQPRPGAEAEDVEVKVHPVPVDPPSVAAADAELPDEGWLDFHPESKGLSGSGRAQCYTPDLGPSPKTQDSRSSLSF